MSKIDTSRVVQVTKCVWVVEHKGKTFGYFSSLEGANEYLEVCRNGSDEIVPAAGGVEKEEIRTVPKVHGVLQNTGSAGSNKPRKRTYPELL